MDDNAVDPPREIQEALADRFSFRRKLGQGGMAVVYLADDLRVGQPVAIKVLKPDVAAAMGHGRFANEIRIASRLSHPHLLPLTESGDVDGLPYYVMPYVEGESLRQRIVREKQLSVAEVLRITCEIADGLSYAHAHGYIHRDIKPENILMHADRAILADFGLARAVTASASDPRTTSGVIMGTAPYMSPEQAVADQQIDGRSDVYSLGCVVYEMLVGEPPFTGANVPAIIARTLSERVPSIRIVRPDVPPVLEDAVRRALAKSPNDRFPSAEAFAHALRACADAEVPSADPPRSRRAVAALAIAGIALLATVGALVARLLGARPFD